MLWTRLISSAMVIGRQTAKKVWGCTALVDQDRRSALRSLDADESWSLLPRIGQSDGSNFACAFNATLFAATTIQCYILCMCLQHMLAEILPRLPLDPYLSILTHLHLDGSTAALWRPLLPLDAKVRHTSTPPRCVLIQLCSPFEIA